MPIPFIAKILLFSNVKLKPNPIDFGKFHINPLFFIFFFYGKSYSYTPLDAAYHSVCELLAKFLHVSASIIMSRIAPKREGVKTRPVSPCQSWQGGVSYISLRESSLT